MTLRKTYILSDWPTLARIEARFSDASCLPVDDVIDNYQHAATGEDWAQMDDHERAFAKAIVASRHRLHPPPTEPFRATCVQCGDTLTSWHQSCIDVPIGDQRGMVLCQCGCMAADSSDRNGMGRIIAVRQAEPARSAP